MHPIGMGRIARPSRIDVDLYSLYSMNMAKPQRKGIQDARNQLPSLVAEAAKGWPTIITRHGRAIAAIVPVDAMKGRAGQMPLIPLARSGQGLWGRHSVRTIRHLRGEWDR
jgi:prevent-host-death family protein